MSTVSAGVCVYCEGWGCTRCGKPPVPRLGEQGPSPEDFEHDRQLRAAVLAEREECACVAEAQYTTTNGANEEAAFIASDIADAIRARGGA